MKIPSKNINLELSLAEENMATEVKNSPASFKKFNAVASVEEMVKKFQMKLQLRGTRRICGNQED